MSGPANQSEADALREYLADRDVPCPGCGYSLRGLDAGTCPECGFGFNLRALLELERRQRFRRIWRRATMLEYRWLGAGLAMAVCGLVIAMCHSAGTPPGWLTLFQFGGPSGPWTGPRGLGWAMYAGICAVGAAAWSQQNEDQCGAGFARLSRRAAYILLAAHLIAAALSFVV